MDKNTVFFIFDSKIRIIASPAPARYLSAFMV